MRRKTIIISMLLALMLVGCFSAHAQQYTDSTKFAIALNLNDVYDAVKGNVKLDMAIQVTPIVPIKFTNNPEGASFYLAPYMNAGYGEEQWNTGGGVGVVKDFGKFYLRYDYDLLNVAEGGNVEQENTSNFGIGFNLGSIFAVKYLKNMYLDVFYSFDPDIEDEVDPYRKRQIEFSIVAIVL